jgi:hypothetical protein
MNAFIHDDEDDDDDDDDDASLTWVKVAWNS